MVSPGEISAGKRIVDRPTRNRKRRGWWLRFLIHSHWMSSAIALVGMVLFAITGITLNHAAQIETEPVVETRSAQLPQGLLRMCLEQPSASESQEPSEEPLPAEVTTWLSKRFSRSVSKATVERNEYEIYLSMPAPGADAWLAIDCETGAVEYESTTRGVIAYLNDLHKGRHTGTAWSWFLDLFSIATLVFCLTGLLLLYERAKRRILTWPLVAIGLIAPWILLVLWVH
ncbi:PepSY-associated TM helix domain-containing protein [Roseimaritima sediminicola]|uniref:PepSY-associated TM helix domain-containing protein n=1 Tax=Roseimaritima sediminicola TaxID=2662066 RepID=UPI001298265B|nr:PepSY-associated TM helix domain-containing protein [Roseimaritima sediminicola]